MNTLKRLSLFFTVNILIVTTISLITSTLGLHSYLSERGIDYQALAGFCLVWGMGGSLFSLCTSRWMVKILMNVKLVDPSGSTVQERQLLQKVHHMARRVGLHTMPQVGIYPSREINAFATGPTRNKALIAVSSGLLTSMNDDEIEGVLAHEMSHVVNGDMVTMTLLQGMVNAFSLFLSRLAAYILSTTLERNGNRSKSHHSHRVYSFAVLVFDILFTFLGSIVVAAFSRHREYRADKGGARLAGRNKMVAALERLRLISHPESQMSDAVATLKINRKTKRNGLSSLLASHPDIDLRIAALRRQ